ncbi:hypothetical protein GCM10027511_33540 [Hymenobacter humi]
MTTVYLVRHAEKDTTPGLADPPLSPVGEVRALALRKQLAKHRPTALFTTDTKRTRSTLAPLAAATRLEPLVYNPKENAALVQRIQQEYKGKTVVVVGHSNTLLPLIEAMGGTSSVKEIGDNEYDYLFTVRLVEGAQPTVTVRHYGAKQKAAPVAKAVPMR